MKIKCDKCDNPASVHLTEISGGQKIEKHLCQDCAAGEGITVKTNIPISQLLEDFILQSGPGEELADLACDVCKITFGEFRQKGLLGCPHDYDAFERALLPLLHRAQDGTTQHVGKVPHRAGSSQKKQNAILRLRGQLKDAVASEDYERAAALRDQIKQLENS
jgi:protein arginine kinase activator